MSDVNGSSDNEKWRRVIWSRIALIQEQGKVSEQQHERVMAEIRGQRAEIEELFQKYKELRETFVEYFRQNP